MEIYGLNGIRFNAQSELLRALNKRNVPSHFSLDIQRQEVKATRDNTVETIDL